MTSSQIRLPNLSASSAGLSETNVESKDVEQAENTLSKWKPSRQVKLSVAMQAFVCFVVALDSTILTTTLPVRQ